MTYTHCVCLKVDFLVQFAAVSTGLQLIDEQLILFRAHSIEDAHQQLTQYTRQLARPYINSDKRWVRWQYDRVLDAYESDLPGTVEVDEAGGTEVFSTFKRRRRRPADYWAGP